MFGTLVACVLTYPDLGEARIGFRYAVIEIWAGSCKALACASLGDGFGSRPVFWVVLTHVFKVQLIHRLALRDLPHGTTLLFL